ncbi:hypothetical protein [Metabacillus litoralis]|uniref:hypothetical protein n=1 Tax=Metabacillus litoralis TaxID=152268 RepID=UPI001CFE5BAF|nr:hypothetical protein [Metabacillus litoralis]
MKENKDAPIINDELSKAELKKHYGMDPEEILQSVTFATTENPYLNEYDKADLNDDE